jgi:hypothetical protein
MRDAWGIIFSTGEVLTVRPVVEGEAVLYEVLQNGLPNPVAYTEWAPGEDSAHHRLRLLAMAFATVMIKEGDERFLDHLISILPPPEPGTIGYSGPPAEAGECSAAGVAPAGEVQAAQAGE